jgi:hypothetical protein
MRLCLVVMAAAVVCSACDTSGAVFARPSIDTAMPDPTPTPAPVIPVAPTEPCVQTDSKAFTILRWSTVGQAFEYSFPVRCGRTDLGLADPLTIVGPDNQSIEGRVTITSSGLDGGTPGQLTGTIGFVPSQPGLHTVKWTTFPRPDLWVQVVTQPPVQRIVREFSDRMDLCVNGVFLTPSGFTVCAPENLSVRIYDPTGALVQAVVAWPRETAVVGNTMWSTYSGGGAVPIEARSFSDAGIKLLGSTRIELLAQGPITETTFERGFVEVSIRDGGLEQTTLRPWFRTDSAFTILEGPNVLSAPGCRARPGCSAMVSDCPPVLSCFVEPPFGLQLLGVTPDALWFLRPTDLKVGRIVMVKRPVDVSTTIRVADREIETAAAPIRDRSPTRVMMELPHVVIRNPDNQFQGPEEVMIPIRRDDTVRFVRVTTQGRVVAVTPHAVAAQLADPFKVEFLLLPPSL